MIVKYIKEKIDKFYEAEFSIEITNKNFEYFCLVLISPFIVLSMTGYLLVFLLERVFIKIQKVSRYLKRKLMERPKKKEIPNTKFFYAFKLKENSDWHISDDVVIADNIGIAEDKVFSMLDKLHNLKTKEEIEGVVIKVCNKPITRWDLEGASF